MDTKSLFGFLEAANEKPGVFSKYTARDLWTDEHVSEQMLAHHLNENTDFSSRNGKFIDESARWMMSHFELSDGCKIADFGCGPGLYSARLAQRHADVLGIDFSARSIKHAREYARVNCALAPAQRARLLSTFRGLLADGGRVVLDVYSLLELSYKHEKIHFEKTAPNGFWANGPYYAFVSSFKYESEKVSLDKYTIVEEGRQREIYNWLQYFTPDSLRQEVSAAGLEIDELYGDVAGKAYDAEAPEFAVVLKRAE